MLLILSVGKLRPEMIKICSPIFENSEAHFVQGYWASGNTYFWANLRLRKTKKFHVSEGIRCSHKIYI